MPDILIAGIAVADAIARPIDRLPEPGGLRFFDDLAITSGGCAINAAIALARLGVAGGCDVAARVGADMLGDFISSELHRHKLSTRLLARDAARTTSFSFAAVGASGERAFLHTTGANAAFCLDDIPLEEVRPRKFLLVAGSMLMDTFDGEQTAELLREARRHRVTTLLDTVFVESAGADEWQRRVGPALAHLDYFIPSFPEARALSGEEDPEAAARLFHDAGVRNTAIKLGAGGVFVREASGAEHSIPAFEVERVVDATGAGDCWAAGFVAGLSEGLNVPGAARLGNAVAACGIQAPGATAGVKQLAEVRVRFGL
jgi:sugar/nucleoside kinase (ribokinase family)